MFSSRFRWAKRGVFAVLVAVAGMMSLAPGAMARSAYVANSGGGTVSAIDTATNLLIATIPVGTEPVDVAIVPDGTRAYVVNKGDGTVSVIDTATNAVVATIPVGSEPRGVAIAPNGARAYVANSGDGTVSVIDTAAVAVIGAPIEVGAEPDGVAVSPDGSRVFVAQRSANISVIDTATSAVVDSVPDILAPARLAIGPRGGRGFVTNSGSSSVTAFNPINGNVVGAPVTVGSEPAGMAIDPSGSLAYVASPADGTISVVDTSLSSPLSPALGGFPGATGVAIEPGGLRGFVTDGGGISVTLLDTARNIAAGAIPVGAAPAGVAVVPNQGPTASFFVSPTRRRAKRKLTFHGSGSTDPDGQVATYAWDFGDGGHVEGSAATRVHRYRRPGDYTVTLVVDDDEGCSTAQIFTGQTAYCNGSAAAAVTKTITVADTRGPVLRLAGGRRQRLRGRINVFARCPREPCTVRARGVVVTKIEGRNGKRRRRHRMGRAIAAAPAGTWVRMRLRVPRRTRRAVLRALRRGGKAKARLAVVARDEVGDRTLHRRNVKLVWPRPRR
jgi:YVTN family beta-propeller protein